MNKHAIPAVKRFCHAVAILLVWGLTIVPVFCADFSFNTYAKQPTAWFAGTEARQIADNVLTFQTVEGGWPKRVDMAQQAAKPEQDKKATIDNEATWSQMRFLARVYNAGHDDRDKAAFMRGLDYLLKAQYPNGGWPQYYPLRKGYSCCITYNDDAMISVMALLRDVARGEKDFTFVDEAHRTACEKAIASGLDCILKTQIVVNGKLTAWCQQHDEVTLVAAKARAYELPSICSHESAGIVRYLMTIENPSPQVCASINGAMAWFEATKIEGIRVEKTKEDRIVVKDASAPPVWARYYEIDTNRPFFCGRDGVKKYSMDEIEQERR
ncbi:TPA: pectate lyase, partial [Candidatus Sumerlaeota bacterium]|nr:pectate lyase [Candidatus Sumerlaeota bacterium]